ncbi:MULTISPECIES: porin [unclassified Burkholderia]|uniref:porin n=1 Tax=unclassified Burkholderia TaxID=2613784 RepID=UPI0005CEDFCE|nr:MULTISPECIES: porin [unclassified Burkholderia]MCR4466148.1 porin [Burkholderia sp. SCN-KJ]RQR44270.1 porin [Burkholderia sp. Bp9131]RQR71092.1 porin [Burkholderia sp. Bp9015]RQR80534.1 porin [Burkholderia sp. Bp9011]RQR89983.1 porin [Burkholderia sp. Bp9010]
MNRIVVSGGVGAVFAVAAASPAFAQSSVTLYGLVDTAIRYQTNAGPDGRDLVGMTVGPETHSRWGLRGSEDLGGGLAAIFRLENGFELGDGRLHVANTLFSRQAYVGLASDRYGSLTFGNQYAPLYDTMGDVFDPMTVGDYWQDSWAYNGIGNYLTVANSVKYKFSTNGFSVDAIYGFGNHAGAMGLDSTYGVELTYAQGPASINAGFQQTSVSSVNGSAVNGAKVNFLHVSGAYQVTPSVRLLAGWLHGQDKTGTTDFNMQQAGAPTLGGGSPNRIDDTFYVGANWQATAPLLITVAGYYGHARNAERLDGTLGSGINYSATVLAEYALSKHTEVYGTVDFARGNGAFAADYPGATNRLTGKVDQIGRTNNVGAAIGLRQMF